MKRTILFFLLSGLLVTTQAQVIISEQAYLTQVLLTHPIAKSAANVESIGYYKLLKAKGGFDPKLELDYNQKSFDDKNYFQQYNSALKIPTWIGADVKIAYNWNNGLYNNLENTLPSNGLISAGIELPILQGLIFDKRRADLQTAQNYEQLGSIEKQLILNQLLYESRQAYWQWFEANNKLTIANEGLSLAEETFNFVKSTYRLGDKPAIDTLEALIQIQTRQLDQSTAQLEVQNTALWLSSFLWIDYATPGFITDNAVAETFFTNETTLNNYIKMVASNIDSVVGLSPKIRMNTLKINNLDIAKKLSKEMLKPQLNLGYNFINQPFNERVFDQLNIANYKWNVNFAMPLFLRKERGDFKIAQANLENAELEFLNSQNQKAIKLEAIINKIMVYQEQLDIASKNVENNAQLVRAEKRRFEIGESSLFLVNYREVILLKAMQKEIEIQAKLKMSVADLEFEIGW